MILALLLAAQEVLYSAEQQHLHLHDIPCLLLSARRSDIEDYQRQVSALPADAYGADMRFWFAHAEGEELQEWVELLSLYEKDMPLVLTMREQEVRVVVGDFAQIVRVCVARDLKAQDVSI